MLSRVDTETKKLKTVLLKLFLGNNLAIKLQVTLTKLL